MKFTRMNDAATPLIDGYDLHSIRIGGQNHSQSLRLTPDQPPQRWEVTSLPTLTTAQLDLLVINAPELLLIGTGRNNAVLEFALYARLTSYGIGFELMDTGAACRTYNLLVGEGRRVAAGLIVESAAIC